MKEEEIESFSKDFKNTIGTMKKEKTEIADALLSLVRSIHKEAALSIKEKELICLGISVYARCQPCIVLHTRSALEAGATKEQLIETCGAALMMGGISLVNFVSTVLEVFEKSSRNSG